MKQVYLRWLTAVALVLSLGGLAAMESNSDHALMLAQATLR